GGRAAPRWGWRRAGQRTRKRLVEVVGAVARASRYTRYQVDGRRHRDDTEGTYGGTLAKVKSYREENSHAQDQFVRRSRRSDPRRSRWMDRLDSSRDGCGSDREPGRSIAHDDERKGFARGPASRLFLGVQLNGPCRDDI